MLRLFVLLLLTTACSSDTSKAVDGRVDAARADGPMERADASSLNANWPIGPLSEAEREAFCAAWIGILGGEGHQVECPQGTVTVMTIFQCVNARPNMACPVTVGEGLACARALAVDLCANQVPPPECEGFYVPECKIE